MVFRRCAIVSTVQWENSLRMVFWMRSSVSRSTAAVASSRMSMRDFRSRARAKQSSCLWPRLLQMKKNQKQQKVLLKWNHFHTDFRILYRKEKQAYFDGVQGFFSLSSIFCYAALPVLGFFPFLIGSHLDYSVKDGIWILLLDLI